MDELPRAEELAKIADLKKAEQVAKDIKAIEEEIYHVATEYGLREFIPKSVIYTEIEAHLRQKGYKVSLTGDNKTLIKF